MHKFAAGTSAVLLAALSGLPATVVAQAAAPATIAQYLSPVFPLELVAALSLVNVVLVAAGLALALRLGVRI